MVINFKFMISLSLIFVYDTSCGWFKEVSSHPHLEWSFIIPGSFIKKNILYLHWIAMAPQLEVIWLWMCPSISGPSCVVLCLSFCHYHTVLMLINYMSWNHVMWVLYFHSLFRIILDILGSYTSLFGIILSISKKLPGILPVAIGSVDQPEENRIDFGA